MTAETSTVRGRVPPGPPGGPFHSILPSLRNDPLNVYLGAQRSYGDVARLRVFGPVYLYLVSHPDDVEHVLRTNVKNYPKGFIADVLRPGLGEGLLTSEGELWLRQRRLMQPAFHRRQVATFVHTITDATSKLLACWEAFARSRQSFDVAAEMNNLTLEIVSRTLFGLDVSGEAGPVRQALAITHDHTNYRFTHPFSPPPWIPTPRNRRSAAALRRLDGIVHKIIDVRRRSPDEHNDLLARLLAARDAETGAAMSDKQLRDEVLTILLAGHDTTSNALAWLFYLLTQHPEVEGKLHAEVTAVLQEKAPTFDDLPRLRYTRMVIDEALRLYPPAWATARQAKEADEIREYAIPARSPVVISQYVTHRHPAFWEAPDTFDPERFSPERSMGRHTFAYFPFSGGPRQCIGKDFALIEMQIILAMVVQRYRLALVPGHPIVPEAMINLRPRRGVCVRLHEQ